MDRRSYLALVGAGLGGCLGDSSPASSPPPESDVRVQVTSLEPTDQYPLRARVETDGVFLSACHLRVQWLDGDTAVGSSQFFAGPVPARRVRRVVGAPVNGSATDGTITDVTGTIAPAVGVPDVSVTDTSLREQTATGQGVTTDTVTLVATVENAGTESQDVGVAVFGVGDRGVARIAGTSTATVPAGGTFRASVGSGYQDASTVSGVAATVYRAGKFERVEAR